MAWEIDRMIPSADPWRGQMFRKDVRMEYVLIGIKEAWRPYRAIRVAEKMQGRKEGFP
jgi:hypothetical protein